MTDGLAGASITNGVFSVHERDAVRIAPSATGATVIVNSLLWGNGWPSQGAALKSEASGLELFNSIVTANRGGLDCAEACTNSHDIIWGNFTDYLGSAASGEGNLAVDPGLTNLSEGDFTLTGQPPAVDAGTDLHAADHDYFGASRPSGAGVDIGPHELPQDVVAPILITEVMANPPDEAAGEYIELMNPGAAEGVLAGGRRADRPGAARASAPDQ